MHVEGGAALLRIINARLPKPHPGIRVQMQFSFSVVWEPSVVEQSQCSDQVAVYKMPLQR